MKKHLLLISMAVSVGLAANAQSTKKVSLQNPKVAQMKNLTAVPTKIRKADAVETSSTKTTATPAVKNTAKRTSGSASNPYSAAQTTYELHANTGLAARGCNVSVVVTGSQLDLNATSGATWTDRGTYYNYYNGTAGTWGANPTARLESVRTGWPVIAVTKSGKEVIVSHDAATGMLVVMTRPVAGTGAWTTNSAALKGTWPRIVAGGPNGEAVHVIAADQNNNNFTTYHRSLDGGITWDIQNQVLPGMNSAGGYELTSGNDYSIDARGNTIAIASGGSFNDAALWKSTDNGATWTKTVIWDFPISNYNPKGNITDADSDGVADTLENTDGYFEVLLDKNNQAHWWAGYSRILDNNAASTDSGWFYFPGLNGLLYWNESWGADTVAIITGAPDVNGNGALDYTAFQTYNGPTLASMASAALDTVNGTILVALSCPTEGDTLSDGNVYRDIYYITSTDNGATWTETDTTARLTKAPGEEDVYPVILNFTDNAVVSNWNSFPAMAAWQRGFDPGSFFSNPSRPVEANDYLVYLPAGCIMGVANVSDTKDFTVSQNYPNPFSNETTISVSVRNASEVTLEVYSVMGQKVMSKNANVSRNHDFKVSKSDLGAGVYFYTVKSGANTATGKMIVE